jgi:hypothetical protein
LPPTEEISARSPTLSATTQSLFGRKVKQDLKLKDEIRMLDSEIEQLQACLRAAIKK